MGAEQGAMQGVMSDTGREGTRATASGRGFSWRAFALALMVGYALIYILPLGLRPMAVPDESRYSEIPREMILSGDWVVPRINGVLYFEKPVLGYWLSGLSFLALGETLFAGRLPSALSAGFTAFFLFLLVRRFGGGPTPGLLAATVFLTSAGVFALGIIHILDSPLNLFLTAGMVSFFYACQEDGIWKRRLLLLMFGACCGLAFLIKGFLAFAVPVITVIPFLLWERRFRDLYTMPWIPLIGAAVVSLPWALLIHVREPEFWHYFFWTEHIARFFSPMPGQHPKPVWYFVPVILGAFLPWTALIPAGIAGLRRLGPKDPLIRFGLCWLVFPFLFFSLSSGKLFPYILPCLPPLAMLLCLGLVALYKGGSVRNLSPGAWFMAGVALVFSILLVAEHTLGVPDLGLYERRNPDWALAASGLLAWAVCAFYAGRDGPWTRRAVFYAAGPLFLFLSAQAATPDRVLEGKAPGELIVRNQAWAPPSSTLVSDPYLVHAVCWFYQREDVLLLERAGELAYGLAREARKPSRVLTLERFQNLLSQEQRAPVILVVKEGVFEMHEGSLPPPVHKDEHRGFVFAVF